MRALPKARLTTLAITAFVVALRMGSGSAWDRTATLWNALDEIGLSTRDMQSVATGRPVAKLLQTDEAQEIAVFGSVRIDVPADSFVERFRDIARFESGPNVKQIGTFSQPPRLEDVKALRFPPEDLRALSRCEIGDCAVKVPAAVIASVQREAGRVSETSARTEALLKGMLVTLVTAYRTHGNRALAELRDQERPLRPGQVLEGMLQKESPLLNNQPELREYLLAYPVTRLRGAEEFFYWSLVDFGMKPTLRVNHVTIYQPSPGRGIRYAIASKQLYASHYFDAALELKLLVDDPESADPNRVYLLVVNRARIGGLTGFRGFLIRPSTRRRTRDALDRYLRATKTRLERAWEGEK
ncbi:MAG: hypothetical protein GEU99_15960 [Luteitalea sp.]|nr:hypothetical protein [Luteitalea sp.]